jgi:nitronate monooxygenase
MLKIGERTARLPIIQGGMGVGVSLSGLASAVARQGGVGVIAAAAIGWREPDFKSDYLEANSRAMRKEIRKARENSGDGLIGVNVMVALTNYDEIIKASVEEGADVIFSGAGLPMHLPGLVGEGPTPALVPIVSSGRAAALICRKWQSKYGRLPDAVVVEGPKAGGHLGFKRQQLDQEESRLEVLVPQVVQALEPYAEAAGGPIPVIAAGGVFTGADIRKYLEMGAAGVQMGTRFVATHECDAAEAFKQAFVEATPEDQVIVNSPVGLPGRALRNTFINDVEAGKRKPYVCPYHCLQTCDYTKSPYCIALALVNATEGRLGKALVFAGANAHQVREIVSVKELMDSLVAEYHASA